MARPFLYHAQSDRDIDRKHDWQKLAGVTVRPEPCEQRQAARQIDAFRLGKLLCSHA